MLEIRGVERSGGMRGDGKSLCAGAFDAVRGGLYVMGTESSERGFCLFGKLFNGERGGLCFGYESHVADERVCPGV